MCQPRRFCFTEFALCNTLLSPVLSLSKKQRRKLRTDNQMNPFSYGTIVKEPYFFDREEECQRIVATLSGGNNLVLFAPRRFGKTLLVFRAIEELEKKGFICIYFDFMPIYSRESFIEAYSKAIISKQDNIQKAVKALAKFVKGIRPKLVFNQSGNPDFSMDFTENKVNEKTLEKSLICRKI